MLSIVNVGTRLTDEIFCMWLRISTLPILIKNIEMVHMSVTIIYNGTIIVVTAFHPVTI